MKKNKRLAVALFTATAWICAFSWPGDGQEKPAPATEFPEKILDGNPNFSLALMFQGDVRGNFGPCG